ncbi:protein of unknown function [Oenococcus oeni]|nr:hypothetical protein OENI_20108 [Oenococcus oeni]SYW03908.1 hypothetical protein OENI_90046 [Oenococcus oeni]SYW17679.1 hypothetical protein OENI_10347 [Oenococcus oeni]VDC14596.1 protein of unknown function [Oenococcus oeni]
MMIQMICRSRKEKVMENFKAPQLDPSDKDDTSFWEGFWEYLKDPWSLIPIVGGLIVGWLLAG